MCVFCVCVCLSEKGNTHTYTLSHQDKKKYYNLHKKKISFVTDLSAAGSPAELKHITQRRKRKQP